MSISYLVNSVFIITQLSQSIILYHTGCISTLKIGTHFISTQKSFNNSPGSKNRILIHLHDLQELAHKFLGFLYDSTTKIGIHIPLFLCSWVLESQLFQNLSVTIIFVSIQWICNGMKQKRERLEINRTWNLDLYENKLVKWSAAHLYIPIQGRKKK